MVSEQYVCLVCGYNMVGFHPDACPFCGADQERFITAKQCSERFHVGATPVNEKVTRLNSEPALGLEHAAYRIETGGSACWIDCPSCYDTSLAPVGKILFTHHHFLGASNLYREHFGAEVGIHEDDAHHQISRPFIFDQEFTQDFTQDGIEAFPVDGHTPGFTFYIFEDTLFICDYVFTDDEGMKLNPFGPADQTIAGSRRIRDILTGRRLATVCGYNYVMDFADWWRRFETGPPFGGF